MYEYMSFQKPRETSIFIKFSFELEQQGLLASQSIKIVRKYVYARLLGGNIACSRGHLFSNSTVPLLQLIRVNEGRKTPESINVLLSCRLDEIDMTFPIHIICYFQLHIKLCPRDHALIGIIYQPLFVRN